MQSYTKRSVVPSIKVHYNGEVEASMQGQLQLPVASMQGQ
jgi:hypothetical protein